MAEARGPAHLFDVCNQKFSEFLFNAEHKCLVWLREIEEEALKMFSSNFSAEPELIPKTPSQKRCRKKKRSLSFKDENKEQMRKRLSRRRSSVKTASFQRFSASKEGLKNFDMGIAVTTADLMMSSAKEPSETQNNTVITPRGEEALGTDCSQETEIKGKRNEGVLAGPETVPMCSGGHLLDGPGATEMAGVANGSPVILSDTLDPAKTVKDWSASRVMRTSTPKALLNGMPTCQGEEIPTQELDNNLVPEDWVSEELKDSIRISVGSQSGCRRSNRPPRNRSISLVEKYSLSNKRKSAIRKSISRTIARKKAAHDSSSASSRVSCHSSVEVFMDDETSKLGPLLAQSAESGETLQKMPSTLGAPNLTDSCAVQSPDQLQMEQGEVCSKGLVIIWDMGFYDATKPLLLHICLMELTLPSLQRDLKLNLTPTVVILKTQPRRPLPMNSQKIVGTKVISKHSVSCLLPQKRKMKTPLLVTKLTKLHSLLQKRYCLPLPRKREERLRKALQARERVEQMEEEKKKRLGQKFSQQEERSEKVREEKMAEEKTKKKMSIKKMGEAYARKQKLLQVEEEPKLQEQPERWKTVGEIKKMLEHKSAHQGKGHHGQQDKERLMKPLELAALTEEEENLKEGQNPNLAEQPQKKKQAVHVEEVPAVSKWLNITAQKSVDSPKHRSSQDLKDATSLKVNLNDYGMDLNSDDSTDDESQPRKPIPLWANGACLQLNEAVTYQYYNPPDINKLFGLILSPKLENIFYKSKPRYFKRTSSAVWQSPPQPGTKTALRASNSMKKH
ncbi:Inner centromere protein [Varanus komodoensis]|nr:Inner centromere protein [Varanus komodoensis]